MQNSFRHVTGKLGNMRKVVEWTVYPVKATDGNKRLIQSDKRIAQVDIETGEATLSSGKGGHQGFHMLNPMMRPIKCQCPQEIIDQLKNLEADHGVQSSEAGVVVMDANGPAPTIQARTGPVSIFDL